MIVDGRGIALDILKSVKIEADMMEVAPHLTVFTCAPDFATQKFLKLKKKRASEVGIGLNVIEFPSDITTADVVTSMQHAMMQTDGIIVQLPFPAQVDLTAVHAAIPPQLDADVVHYNGLQSATLPPVAGALEEIVKRYQVFLTGQKIVIVGNGRLVGAPAEIWARAYSNDVTVITRDTTNNESEIAAADVLILGAGVPGLVTPGMVKDNVIILDAGTSEDAGELRGDAQEECAVKASLFTPVPGGIGPITVAVLLRNLVALAKGA